MPTTKQKAAGEEAADKGPALGRLSVYADEAFWLGLAARMTKQSQADLISGRVREFVRAVLVRHGTDPDRAWAETQKDRA